MLRLLIIIDFKIIGTRCRGQLLNADGLKDSLSKFDWRKNRGLFLDNGQRRCFSFFKRALTLDTFARGDYRKLCSLTVMYLGRVVQDFSFPRPGAMSNARFMSNKSISLCWLYWRRSYPSCQTRRRTTSTGSTITSYVCFGMFPDSSRALLLKWHQVMIS